MRRACGELAKQRSMRPVVNLKLDIEEKTMFGEAERQSLMGGLRNTL